MAALAALAQPTRLAVLELLLGSDPGGVPAGEIARRIAIPSNTLSNHLAVMSRSGLVTAERRSRTILYRSDRATVDAVRSYLEQLSCRQGPIPHADAALSS